MLRRINKSGPYGKRAFTLVELIVVLVILAVLSAMLVPSLTGYIKKARKAKYIQAADEARIAAQAIMAEYYGRGNVVTANHVNNNDPDNRESGGGGSGGDNRWDIGAGAKNEGTDNPEWGERVLALMGRDRTTEPYILIFGVGHPDATNLSESDRYTVYYIAYVEDANSPAIFYVDGEWIYQYPGRQGAGLITKPNDGRGINANVLVHNGRTIPLQLYVVSNNTGISDNFFTSGDRRSLLSHSEGHNGY